MSRSLDVAAVQLQARDRDAFSGAFAGILATVARAARDADLLVLPEGTIPGYVLGHQPLDERSIAAALAELASVARENATVIVVGAAVADGGVLRNGAVVIDADGSLAGRADKLFLWHFDRRWFACGERLAPVRTSAGSLGVLVCADGRLPTISRELVDRGADLLVMPTAWVTSGRDPDALENVQADLLARVRAYENRVPFVAANKCGSELGMVAYCGKSQIVDARGEIVAIASERSPETLHASLTLDGERAVRAAPVLPAPAPAGERPPLRIAIAGSALPAGIDARLELLDDAYALAPDDTSRLEKLKRELPAAAVDDQRALDPGGLVAYRRAGYGLIVWSSDLGEPWLARLARARALELRLYVVAFDRRSGRAFAVDPDGAIVAGTFGDFHLASFTFDPRKTRETSVAPGTDVAEGLERIAALTGTQA
ncbi:MAG TPA: carbon-nitrogen hydrolase family protein [Candidatus Cybelea sp.]|jgi:predicted amidohydrolase|nr:carbon-nitrogen hydrolase family protein [Candidatus Cybelea sp.]